jgi:hypothetical protein
VGIQLELKYKGEVSGRCNMSHNEGLLIVQVMQCFWDYESG